MRFYLCACALLLAMASGCAGTKTAAVEMQALEDFEVSYIGGIGDGSDTSSAMPEVTSTEDETATSAHQIEVQVLRMSLDDARKNFGKRVTEIGAFSIESNPVELKLLRDIPILSAPRVTIYDGQTGVIQITNQISYISGFEFSGEKSTRIADPIVDVLNEGLVLSVKADKRGEGRVHLELELLLSEVAKPIKTQDVKLLGAPMTIQTPVAMNQRLTAKGEFDEDRTLVLAGMIGRDDEVTLLLVKSAAIEIEPAKQQPKDE